MSRRKGGREEGREEGSAQGMGCLCNYLMAESLSQWEVAQRTESECWVQSSKSTVTRHSCWRRQPDTAIASGRGSGRHHLQTTKAWLRRKTFRPLCETPRFAWRQKWEQQQRLMQNGSNKLSWVEIWKDKRLTNCEQLWRYICSRSKQV